MTYMKTMSMESLVRHLQIESAPFMLKRDGKPPRWKDEDFHQAAYRWNPELYALGTLGVLVHPEQRVRVLFQLLSASRAGFSPDRRRTLDRVTGILLTLAHPDRVLTVFLALRRQRINHKHTSRAILRYILNHPRLEDMAGCRRSTLVDCLEHAMGRNTARACARMLTSQAVDDRYLNSKLLRFASDSERAREIFLFLYRERSLPVRSAESYSSVHREYAGRIRPEPERPRTITATNRGDIAATLVHIYRGGSSPELLDAVDRYVQDAAAQLPRYDGRMALVLDASASTQGYGDREYCCIAQSVAFKMVLDQCCRDLMVFQAGGMEEPPRPEGATDLARPLVEALECDPDLVVIVSDGYENVFAGDLARVATSLPGTGVSAPVVFCHSMFTSKDNLEIRRPVKSFAEFEFWHEDDFKQIILTMFSLARDKSSGAVVKETLLNRLEILEKEVEPWISEH